MEQEKIWRKQVKEMLGQMTLEEKVSQLSYRSPGIKRLGIPCYNWWNEALHGVARAGTATSLPQCIGMAASFDSGLIKKAADIIATEGRAKYNESIRKNDRDIYKGLTFWCPNVNIFRDPRWGRGHETFGEDPYLTASLATAYIRGLQGDGQHLKGAACAKHFAVHSGPEEGRHSFDAAVSQKDLWETYLPAFEACVKEAGAEGVMGAYNAVNGEACCASRTLLKDILRGKWKFDGYVVSDCGAIADIHLHHGFTRTAEESAALALEAGCDLNCGNIYLQVYRAVLDGLIPEHCVDEAVEHLLMTRMRLGMFEPCEYDDIPYEVVECKEHCEFAEEAAIRSMVLLKNNGILPLRKEKLSVIGVIGPNADSRTALWGNYYGTSSHNTTLLEGIRREAGDSVRILFSEGSHLYKETVEGGAAFGDRIAEALSVAERSDVVVLCIGLDATIEGEEGDASNEYAAGDKKTLSLPKIQEALLEAVVSAGKPVVVCVMAGSALDLSFAEKHADAILQMWYPGAFGGTAAAKLLFGEKSPSAKLPVTFYRSVDDLPDFRDYSMKGRTYRYLEAEPLYPFGYGLNYGNISCTDAVLECRGEGELWVRASVSNDGEVSAGDVLEVYIKNEDSSFAVKNWSLCGVKPFYLEGGKQKILELKIEKHALETVDESGRRNRDGRHFTFYAGCSQPDKRSICLTGKRPVEIKLEL